MCWDYVDSFALSYANYLWFDFFFYSSFPCENALNYCDLKNENSYDTLIARKIVFVFIFLKNKIFIFYILNYFIILILKIKFKK